MQAKRYAALLVLTYLMNLFDLHYTLWALTRPGVWELNPLCRAALAVPGMLEVYKYAGFPLLLWLLYRFREVPLARFGIYSSFAVFLTNTLYQVTLIRLLA
ncbi:MAG: hypothetical protein IJX52_07210 [Oscillibacter sp.]|nr:hypothetical protein [Oscillibacter sp.]